MIWFGPSLMYLAAAQVWQLTALILAVLLATRWGTRRWPHLAYVLWLLVLLKCLTPPLWSAPSSLFCWAQTALAAPPATPTTWQIDPDARPVVPIRPPNKMTDTAIVADARSVLTAPDNSVRPGVIAAATPRLICLQRVLLTLWLVGTGGLVSGASWRCWRFLQGLRRSAIPHSADYDNSLARMSRLLGLRARTRLWVTSSHCGPAVVGLFRPVIVLPEVLVQGKQPEELESILAHELIHVRRGDLWLGLLQAVAKALWWFHPLVWLAARQCSREAERCCDEEVIGSLGCDPARYARSLLEILELKRTLQMVPAFPGMKPVDVTSQRLERIMQLREGCRERTPWWCWMILMLSAAVTLPGAALLVADDEPAAPASAAVDTGHAAAGEQCDQDNITPREPSAAAPTSGQEHERADTESDNHYAYVYNVIDLLDADGDSVAIAREPRSRDLVAKAAALRALVAQIRAEVLTVTWNDSGGSRTVEAVPANLSLVVLHTAKAHLAVHDYLNNLRKQRGLPQNPDKPPARCPPRDDGVIQTRTYAVADLVIPVPNFASSTTPQRVNADFKPMIELIKSTVAPSSWSGAHGTGTITAVPANLSLTIEATSGVHREIANLLEQLRELQDVQVTVETTILGLPQQMFEQVGKEIQGDAASVPENAAFAQAGWSRLSETEATRLKGACQANDLAEVRQSPKLTLFNGQVGQVAWQDHGAKVTLQYQGIVAADGKSVQLMVMLEEARPGCSPRGCSERVPDGSALLLDATNELRPWADAQTRSDAVARHSGIPDLSGLPQKRSGEIDRVMLLVTPRVLVSKEVESAVLSPRQHP